jgi:hypothetical protein
VPLQALRNLSIRVGRNVETTMPNSSLLNVPSSQEDWDRWSFNHAQEHINIIQAIQKQKNIQLTQYQLDPVNMSNPLAMQDFLERHQQTHIDMDGALGLQSTDLQDVDLSDKKKLEAWVYSNFLEHYAANQALEI